MLNEILKLCLLTQSNINNVESYKQFLHEAIRGGVTSVQFRDKHHDYSTKRTIAFALKQYLTSLKVPLIVNDDVDLAIEIDACGVHLGQKDLHPIEARKRLGLNKVIGWSVETDEELVKANELDCLDYIAASAIFPSRSKDNCKTIWGLNGLNHIARLSRYPVVAIGGINFSNARAVIQNGANGIAVISAIHDSDPFNASSRLIQEINQGFSK